MNYMKQRRILILTFFGLVAIMADGCRGRSASLRETASPTAKVATLSEQKMCADQAEKMYRESSEVSDSTYTNHYDPTDGVCYIELTTRQRLGQVFSFHLMVLDAFEGRIYGEYGDHLTLDNRPADPKLDECSVKPRGQPEAKCGSLDEFNQLALRHFGTTPD